LRHDFSPGERPFALFVGLAFVVAAVSPAFRAPGTDSFPLSSYPMFSRGRPDTGLTLVQALGVYADGHSVPLPPSVSADTYEVLQSMVVLERTVREGPARTAALCHAIARRAHDAALDGVVAVEIATSRFDVIEYFTHGPRPRDRRVHLRCEVPR
jgi:hypothetical protein